MADEAINIVYKDISHVQQQVETETDDNNSFVVGDCFESFAKLEARVEKFKNSQFVKRDTRTTKTARK